MPRAGLYLVDIHKLKVEILYCLLYNEHLPQTALNSKTPMDAMNMWYASHPQIFLYPLGSNRPGCDKS
jgi:hypothetical protein